MIARKVCLLGAFAVGKTSLVRQFIEGVFDQRYVTTLGVKIDTKTVSIPGGEMKMIVWDIEGADPGEDETQLVSSRMRTYLQGAQGVLLVADGTRPGTLQAARQLHAWCAECLAASPVVVLINKSDLQDQWRLDPRALESWQPAAPCFVTSAQTGANVEQAFSALAEAMAAQQAS